jgi:hypothetical protein
MTAEDVSLNEVNLFTSTLRAKGTPWGDGCASLIEKLWAEVQARRIEVEKYRAWAASCDQTPPETAVVQSTEGRCTCPMSLDPLGCAATTCPRAVAARAAQKAGG